jgi:hypothetical protein
MGKGRMSRKPCNSWDSWDQHAQQPTPALTFPHPVHSNLSPALYHGSASCPSHTALATPPLPGLPRRPRVLGSMTTLASAQEWLI